MKPLLFYLPQIQWLIISFILVDVAYMWIRRFKSAWDYGHLCEKTKSDWFKLITIVLVAFICVCCTLITVVEAVDESNLQISQGEVCYILPREGLKYKVEIINESTGKREGFWVYLDDYHDWFLNGNIDSGDTVCVKYSLITSYAYEMEKIT